jgi:HlyD family secretion protein
MTPALSIRRPVILGLAATLALVLGFGLWATLTHISGAIVAQGQIEVERDRQVVQHPDGGVVAEILVKEGARVEAGQMLLRLDGAALRSELTIVEGQLSELAGRSARLTAERDGLTSLEFPADILALAETSKEVAAQLDGQRRLFEARAATLAEQRELLARRIDQITAQSNGIAAQSAALTRQLALIEQELASQQSLLDKGLAQAGTVLALQREQARLEGQIGELQAELARQAQFMAPEAAARIAVALAQAKPADPQTLTRLTTQLWEAVETRSFQGPARGGHDRTAPGRADAAGACRTPPRAA